MLAFEVVVAWTARWRVKCKGQRTHRATTNEGLPTVKRSGWRVQPFHSYTRGVWTHFYEGTLLHIINYVLRNNYYRTIHLTSDICLHVIHNVSIITCVCVCVQFKLIKVKVCTIKTLHFTVHSQERFLCLYPIRISKGSILGLRQRGEWWSLSSIKMSKEVKVEQFLKAYSIW